MRHLLFRGGLSVRRFSALLTVLAAFLPGAALADGGGLRVTASPALFPAFDPAVTDYIVRGPSVRPVRVSVTAPEGMQVSVDGGPFREESFAADVGLSEGQGFGITARVSGSAPVTYHVRRLPAGFPVWTAERLGVPQSEWYVAAPSLSFNGDAPRQDYAVVFDGYGVPVWWYHHFTRPYDVKLLDDGNIGWTSPDGIEEYRLDGSPVRVTRPVGEEFDFHELLMLPNGNALMIATAPVSPVDLRPYGGLPDATVSDNIVQEVAPDGSLAWSWGSYSHVPVSETGEKWWAGPLAGSLADPFHMNAIEPDGDGYVLSLRHQDAVLKVDRATGEIVWKLGGAPHPKSLTFVGDPYGNFGGQHDARILPDGTLTLHDNRTGYEQQPPRAVRYELDLSARTATLVEQVTDPDVPYSPCCGNARKLPGGNWVMSWGGTPFVTELSPSGDRLFRLTFGDYFAYRVNPVPHARLKRSALRGGMDARFPRPPAGGKPAPSTSVTASQLVVREGETVTLSATVTVASPGVIPPTGTVRFMDDDLDLGDPVTLDDTGRAALANAALTVGSHEITAVYGGDGSYNVSFGSLSEGPKAPSLVVVKPGDLNRDTFVNVEDAVAALKVVVGLLEATPESLLAGDMDRDGSIDVRDAVALLALIVGTTQPNVPAPFRGG